MITPSANTAVEPITIALTRDFPEVSVHFTRIPVSEVALDDASNRQFTSERFEAAGRLLADARVQVIAWNGTSGSWMGSERERELAQRLRGSLGVPFLTSTMALHDALAGRGVRRYGLAVPYTRDMAEAIAADYESRGLTCVRMAYRGWETEDEIAATEGDLLELLEEAHHPDAEAVVVVCTNVAAATVVAEFERRHRIPVFDSVLVTAVRSLRCCGFRTGNFRGWGAVVASELA
jgi:maleate isomerase